MENIQIFKSEQFGEIRTMMGEKGEPWFVGKDVATVLGYINPRKALLDHVDSEDRMDGVTIRDAIGRKQKVIFINESGLYSLILSSKLDSAKAFKRWVTSDVLPQIRKTGGYIPTKCADGKLLTDLEIMTLAVEIQQKTIEIQSDAIIEMAPKAVYADQVLESVSCYTTTQIAKEMSMTVFDLTKLLLQHGIVYHQSGQYMLYAEYAREGYARTRTKSYRDSTGALHTSIHLVWTEKGRRFLHSIFLKVKK